MYPERHREAKLGREQVRSLWIVTAMAVCTAALRVAIWAANELTLRYLYGSATVERQHLRIIRIKPELVVSNGDVLRGIGFYHYLVGMGIWIPLSVGLLLAIFYGFMPREYRQVFQVPEPKRVQGENSLLLIWAVGLFFLVPGWLPIAPAIALSGISVIIALIWMRRLDIASDATAEIKEGHL